MRKLILSSLIGLMSAVSVNAAAQDSAEVETLDKLNEAPTPRPTVHGPMTVLRPAGLLIASFDTNQDYVISRTEFDIGVGIAFGTADTDGDGNLTLFELEDWRAAALGNLDSMPGNMSFDENYNSRISAEEFKATLEYEFTKADGDEDGEVKFGELIRLVERPPTYAKEERREREDPFADRNQRSPYPRRF